MVGVHHAGPGDRVEPPEVYQLDAIRRAQDAAYQDDPTSFYPHALSSEDRLRLAVLAQGFNPAPTRRSW